MKAGIAGAGIMGQLLAFSLVNAGWTVTLYDNKMVNNCSNAAAGLLTPITELEKNDFLIYQLGMEAMRQRWPTILTELKSAHYFKQRGTIVLAHPSDQTELQHYSHIIGRKLGSRDGMQVLSATELAQLEPELTKFNNAYYFPTEGQIDNQNVLAVLSKYLSANGVVWNKEVSVTAMQPNKIYTDQQVHEFDWVFDCRGLGATATFKNVRAVRGELLWVRAPNVCITRALRFLHPRYSIYIVPRAEAMYLIGASEIEAHDDSPISVQTTLELLTAAYYVNSKFGEARLIKTVTQCRPTLPNHLPQIKYTDGLIAINGLYRHGYLIAPSLAHAVMQWLMQQEKKCYPSLWEKYHD